jgi:hypothetical protein
MLPSPAGGGPDIEQKIAAAADDIDEHHKQLAIGAVIRERLHAVVPVGIPHAAVFLP